MAAGRAVAAVHDGYVLKKSITRSPLGGRLLTQCMQQAVLSKGAQLQPHFSLRRLETAPGKFEVSMRWLDLLRHMLRRSVVT